MRVNGSQRDPCAPIKQAPPGNSLGLRINTKNAASTQGAYSWHHLSVDPPRNSRCLVRRQLTSGASRGVPRSGLDYPERPPGKAESFPLRPIPSGATMWQSRPLGRDNGGDQGAWHPRRYHPETPVDDVASEGCRRRKRGSAAGVPLSPCFRDLRSAPTRPIPSFAATASAKS
jgi:hypothetical protein